MTLSRRRVLAALATAGGAGVVTGGGTAALLDDDERLTSAIGAGAVDLAVGYEVLAGPNAGTTGSHSGTTLELPVAGLTASDDSGTALVSVSLPDLSETINNPAAVWLRLDCPPASALSEHLSVRLSYADCTTGARGDTIADGSLRSVADGLRNGELLDADASTAPVDCLTDELCLLVEYWLDEGYVGTDATELSFDVYGVQCRNDETRANPFPRRPSCDTYDPCVCCDSLGKLELEDGEEPGIGDSYIEPGVYAFSEGGDGYEIEIYDTVEKDDGTETTAVAFRLRRTDGGTPPALCEVGIKAGPGDPRPYTAGEQPTNDTASLEDGGLLYADDGKAISHVTVAVCSTDCEEENQ
ncbi:hypothetical protein [Natronomonas gomsonensis]|uniref:hypothetical protein n=1 Tax=Natronomonas gomsonensis TaxID=1046043 RepID=UPI0015BB5F88|nr:hypothetical protein [Natronomonas gomsonensis]